MLRLLFALFLLAHAGIHASFLAPRPATAGGPAWPFELGRSWLLTPLGVPNDVIRLVGIALVAATIAGFGLAALTPLGVLPASLWPAIAGVGAVGSIAVLVLFFHPWLVLGLAVDVALLWAAFVSGWTPDALAT